MAPSRTTKRSTPRLSDLARHVIAPDGVVSTGWPAVEAKCVELGISFRPWQPGVGRLILAKRADGKYASTIGGTGMSIPRQVGKTFLVGAIVFALCLLRPNLTVIWTAHRLRTAEETFGKMQAFAKRKRIKPFVSKIVLGSGDEAIQFRNGSRILFGARERGFGRGFDQVDVLIFDEAQILTENALDDMIPATNQSRQETSALLLFMGTPPKPTDPGEVFSRMRSEALSGEDGDTGWVEFAADPDYEPTSLPSPLTEADWKQIAKANPSFPQDTPREAILRMRKKLGPESFRREGMGIWDKVDVSGSPFANWPNLVSLVPPADGVAPDALGVDMSHDRVISISGCWSEGDEAHVVLLEVDVTGNTAAAVKWIAGRAGRRIPVVIDGASPAASMSPALKALKVKVVTTGAADMGKACGAVFDAVHAGLLFHSGQAQLDRAVMGSEKRAIGTAGAWGLDRRDPDVNIAPAVSMILAFYGAQLFKRSKPQTPRRVVVLQ